MPIYVYEVILPGGKTGRTFELLQKISDPPLRKDPKTGRPVRRIFTPPNLPQFKFDRASKHFAAEDKKEKSRTKRGKQR